MLNSEMKINENKENNKSTAHVIRVNVESLITTYLLTYSQNYQHNRRKKETILENSSSQILF